MKPASLTCVFAILLGSAVVTESALAADQSCAAGQAVVVRQTIPYPHAVVRQPLTSDRLSTTSTRLIDARRGFRPYSTVFGNGLGYHVAVGVAQSYLPCDHNQYGVSRVSGRLFKYGDMYTGVTTHRNAMDDKDKAADPADQASAVRHAMPGLTVIKCTEPQGVTVHRNENAKPIDDVKEAVARDLGFARSQDQANTVTVYRKPQMPQTSGAVLVAADGTVFTIGE